MDSHYSHHCSERIDGGDSVADSAAAGNEADSADAAGDSVGGGDCGDCDRLPTAEDSGAGG